MCKVFWTSVQENDCRDTSQVQILPFTNHLKFFYAQNKQLPPSIKLTTPTRHATLMQKANCWPTIFYGKVRAVSKTKVTGRQSMKDPKNCKDWEISGISPINIGVSLLRLAAMRDEVPGGRNFESHDRGHSVSICMRIPSPPRSFRSAPTQKLYFSH